jgi:putative ABC transport system substrate-binding protein
MALLDVHELVASAMGNRGGRDVAIEYLWAEGHNDRLPALAADFVRRRVAVIVAAASTPAALAAKAATEAIPIVFFIGTDPVKVGLVASLARPGGHVTGVTALVVELIAKSLQLMHDLMPPATKIGVLLNRSNIPQSTAEIGIVQEAAQVLGAHVVILNASNPNAIEATFGTIVSDRIAALVVSGENFFLMQVRTMAELATRHGVPTIYAYRDFIHAGGLMSYGTHFTDAFRRVGIIAGRILKGEKAADLPVEQVTKIELAINLKAAKTLGLTVPAAMLARADEVIE